MISMVDFSEIVGPRVTRHQTVGLKSPIRRAISLERQRFKGLSLALEGENTPLGPHQGYAGRDINAKAMVSLTLIDIKPMTCVWTVLDIFQA